MSEQLNYEDFCELRNTDFFIVGSEPEFSLTLFEISEHLIGPQTASFALLFKGPADRFLEQNNYDLQNEKLGDCSLFLVPVGREEDGFIYEALFNRIENA